MTLALTQAYVAAFNAKDIDGVGRLLADDVALEDPVVKRIEGKATVLAAVANIFASCSSLAFAAKHIFVDGDVSIIEFTLDLDATHLEGADIIVWRDGRIAELRAYLDIPKG